ncbi:MAG: methyltransferase domain-containing protein [Desulfovermiculus sp.]|nr:methyltransferase domain-containing protein [Desulfovermiculus sp.]
MQRTVRDYPQVTFRQAELPLLPFIDQMFDTVVCTHTLEHIPDIRQAVKELRRVAKKRLIIVLPRQRPYRYTFDLHLHFFPYAWSVLLAMGEKRFQARLYFGWRGLVHC